MGDLRDLVVPRVEDGDVVAPRLQAPRMAGPVGPVPPISSTELMARMYIRSEVVALSDLLLHHPFSDEQGLLHTVDETMTAGQARARVAELIPELAVEPGQAVAVMLPNGPELVCTMAAIWEVGGVYVPVNPRLPAIEVEQVLAETEPALMVSTEGILTSRPRRGPIPTTSPS